MAARKRTSSSSSSTGAAPARYAGRHARLRDALREADVDAILITYPNDIRYLTGFSGEDSYALVSDRHVVVISDSRFEEELQPIAAWGRVEIRRNEPIADRTGAVAKELKLERIGLQSEHLTIAARKSLAKATGARRLKDLNGVLSNLRAIKDADEVKLIRKAIKLQEEALRATLAELKPGQTESDVAARLEYEIKSRGADGAAFRAIVAAGPNSSMPHYNPSPRVKVRPKHALLIDWGARMNGYCGDLTRTFGVGGLPKKMREVYQIVLDAQMKAIDAIRPGALCRDVDSVARDHIREAGYGDQFGHGLGHGLGLDVHEAPSLSQRAKQDAELKPGMIVTVEPGIYLPGVGGVRIEDDVLVTERGRTVLGSYPKDLESAIL